MEMSGEGLKKLIGFLESMDILNLEKDPGARAESLSGEGAALPGTDPELDAMVREFFQKKGPAIMDILPQGSHQYLFIEDYGFMRFN